MSDVSILEPLVRPFVKDCPSILIEHQLRQAVRKFCRDTEIWRVEKIGVQVDAGAARVVIPKTAGQDFLKVIKAQIQGVKDPLTAIGKVVNLPITSGNPLCFSSKEVGAIFVGPIPETSILIDIEIAVMPSVGESDVWSDFTTKWAEAISNFATYQLLNEESYSWFSPELAMKYKKDYLTIVDDARHELNTGGVNAETFASGGFFV